MTPTLVKLSTELDVSEYTPKDGHIVLFVQEISGIPVICCKRSDGSIYQFTSTQQTTTDTEIDEELELLIVDASVCDDVLEVADMEVIDDVLIV